jgi:oligoribonuclease NrnB/cAMP/cGMP phosphodiesterase (DHH superfamily)
MIGIYHSKDFDGVCSGAIMKYKYPDIELIGYDYGEPVPWEKVKGQVVIMADVSLPMPDMDRLAALVKSFVWIDHHASAIKDFKEAFPVIDPASFIVPVLDSKFSACELCWKYFFPERPMPLIVEYLGRYDRWDKSDPKFFDEVLLPFQYGMRCEYPLDPDKFPSNHFSQSLTDKAESKSITLIGRSILKYQAQQNEQTLQQRSFEGTVDGLPALFCNGVPHNSQSFASGYDPEKHKLMVPFYYDGKTWNFSLYSTHEDVDCGAIAKLYGGGGHKGAAGLKRNSSMVAKFLQHHEL